MLLLDTKELSRLIGVSTSALKLWRRDGCGPRYVQPRKRGRVLYRLEDVDAWLIESRRDFTAQTHRTREVWP